MLRPGLRRDPADVDRRLAVEHEPDRVAAPEHRGRRRRREREGQPHRVALPAHVDHHRRRRVGWRAPACTSSRAGIVAGGLGGRLGGSTGAPRAGLVGRDDACRGRGGLFGTGRGGFRGLCGFRRLAATCAGFAASAGLAAPARRAAAQARALLGQRRDRRNTGRGFRLAVGARLDRLDIEDVVVVLAERAHVHLADELEVHQRGVLAGLGVDRRRSSAAARPARRRDRSAAAPRTSCVSLSSARSVETAISAGRPKV